MLGRGPLKRGPWRKRLGGYAGTVLFQAPFGFISVFVGLSVLGPADYGTYAIASIVTGVVASLATGLGFTSPVTIASWSVVFACVVGFLGWLFFRRLGCSFGVARCSCLVRFGGW